MKTQTNEFDSVLGFFSRPTTLSQLFIKTNTIINGQKTLVSVYGFVYCIGETLRRSSVHRLPPARCYETYGISYTTLWHAGAPTMQLGSSESLLPVSGHVRIFIAGGNGVIFSWWSKKLTGWRINADAAPVEVSYIKVVSKSGMELLNR